jgi:hypothetical protein
LKALDSVEVREVLRRLRSAGYKSLVISFLHAALQKFDNGADFGGFDHGFKAHFLCDLRYPVLVVRI